jgi:acetylornithine/N-succinyldiaminopimelate aminotransferase
LVGDAEFLNEVAEKAAFFKAGLEDLVGRHPNTFKSVRGKGLMMGLECAVPNMDFVNAGYDALILTVPAGDNVVRFVPALTITKEEIDEALARLSSAAQSLG